MQDSSLTDAKRFQEMDWLWRRRQETLLSAGEWVDSLMLELSGRGRPAWLILTSDNGLHLGEWSQPIGKGLPIREDTEVPFVVWSTDHSKLPVVSSLVSLVDLTPTLLTLAGVPYNYADFDGLNVIGDEVGPRRNVMEAFTVPPWMSVQQRDTLFVRWGDGTEQWFGTAGGAWTHLSASALSVETRTSWYEALNEASTCEGVQCSTPSP